MPFISCQEGKLTDIFVTESEIVDRFVGNQLWTWGSGTLGKLGANSITTRSSPVQTVSTGTNWVQVSSSLDHTGAIKTDGTLWMWGSSLFGRLGNNNNVCQSSPVQTVSTGTNWRQISLGRRQSGALKTDGTLWMWGCGANGQLGTNNTFNQSSPVQTVSTGTDWRQIGLGCSHSAAIKTDGTLWLWGNAADGRLGNDITSIDQSSPVQTISTGTNWKQVELGLGHSAAVKTDGTLWLWGDNTFGQIGDNTAIQRSSPVQTVSSGNNWKQVSLGYDHSSAIKVDGTLWLWGCNSEGNLGNNSSLNQSSPVQTISTGTNWKQVSSSCRITASIKVDGTLWLWGNNCFGQIGTNTTINQSSPVQTISTGTNWKQISVGESHSSAVTFTKF